MKLKSTLSNMLIVLAVISAVSAALLGATYSGTKDAIDKNAQDKKVRSFTQVLPEFDNNLIKESYQVNGYTVYPATLEGVPVGYVMETYNNLGYGGEVRLLVGFDTAGVIRNINVLKHSETPGLGSKMTEPDFINQFIGKKLDTFQLTVKKDGGDVDALTAATISSRAFCEAVDAAWKVYMEEHK